MTEWHGAINEDELARARERFGLTLPVVIFPDPDPDRPTVRGSYRLHRLGDYRVHQIFVTVPCSVDQASHTIIHELVHAMQAERLGEEHWRHYHEELARRGYRGNAYELEAEYISYPDNWENFFNAVPAPPFNIACEGEPR